MVDTTVAFFISASFITAAVEPLATTPPPTQITIFLDALMVFTARLIIPT